jgi:predicted MFS family arabinose efflux permease
MANQLSTFQARIKRINDPKNDSYLDPELGIRIPKRLSKQIIKTGNSHNARNVGAISLAISLLLGTLSLLAAKYVRFHHAEIAETGTSAQTLMIMDFGLAAVMMFLLGGMIKHKTIRHMGAQVFGIAIMLVAMHNLVWLYPAEFAQVYGQSYVDQVIAATEPLSIYVNGETIAVL